MPGKTDSVLNYRFLNRRKKDPNEFVFTGDSKTSELDIQLFSFNKDQITESTGLKPADANIPYDDKSISWLNVYGIHDASAIASICMKLKADNLTIQDILDVNQRPKFQEFDSYSFFTIKSILPSVDEEIKSEQLSFILGKNYLVSFQEEKADYFDHLRKRLRDGIGNVRERGADYLLFVMLEAIMDNYFRTLQILERDIDKWGLIDPETDPSPLLLKKLEAYRRHVTMIKRTLFPIKEFTLVIERGNNMFIDKSNLKYFFELKDICLTLIDTCETFESELQSHINLFFSVQGQRMNQIMKTLTIVATVFIPLTFIVGIYGMNFPNMPEIGWKYGYASVWAVMIISVVGMIIYFIKKKWF
ncbi:MAG: magnesium/cobalt transporter CorA [Bacteroidales bacterium]|nr:magnesium/cobalt transporter CorA [Bacteroidales bacterium]